MNLKSEMVNVVTRMKNAHDNFIETIQEIAKCSNTQAQKVFDVYRKEKIIKLDIGIGRYQFKHGAFLDNQVIWNAINLMDSKI